MIAIDLGHRFGHLGRIGPDGQPDVTETEFDGTDGVLDPGRALPALRGLVPGGRAAGDEEGGRAAIFGMPARGGREDELRRAADRAGLHVERVVPDPVAVALHYGAVAEGVDRTVLVCDQGATTLDLTVLAITPDLTVHVVEARSHRLGGDDWDAALATRLAGRLPDEADPRRSAERLRRGIPDADGVSGIVDDAGGGQHRLTLDREEFELAVAPLREQALAAVSRVLTEAEPVVDTVLLAGGLCATPGRRAEVEGLPTAQGLTVRCDRPELAVVHGLLRLRDFGVLRITEGPAPLSPRTGNDYFFPRPVPVRDPDPGPWQPLPEDPEPLAGGADTAAAATGTGATPEDAPPGAGDAGRGPDSSPGADGGQGEDAKPGPDTRPGTQPVPGASAEPEADSAKSWGSSPGAASAPGSATDSEVAADAKTDTAADAEATATAGTADPQNLVAVPVEQLQALRRGDHLLVLWAWPDGALSARVRWRREGSASRGGPRDEEMVCRRRVYEHDGGLDLEVGREAVTLVVEALIADPDADCEGRSALVVPALPPLVTYEPSVRRRGLTGRVATVTFTSETGCDLPGLRIVHSLGRFRPTSTAEGTVLHEVPAQRLSARTPLTVEFSLPAARGPSWLVCFRADGDAANGTSFDSEIDIRPTALHRLRVT